MARATDNWTPEYRAMIQRQIEQQAREDAAISRRSPLRQALPFSGEQIQGEYTPGGTLFGDVSDRPIISPLVDVAEAVFGTQRLGQTALDAAAAEGDLASTAIKEGGMMASMLAQAIATGGAGAPRVAATMPSARQRLLGFYEGVGRSRRAAANARGMARARALAPSMALAGGLSAQATLRRVGTDDPMAVFSSALIGAGAGALPGVQELGIVGALGANLAYDIGTAFVEFSRYRPELAVKIASGDFANLTPQERSEVLQAGLMSILPSTIGSAVSVGMEARGLNQTTRMIQQRDADFSRRPTEIKSELGAVSRALFPRTVQSEAGAADSPRNTDGLLALRSLLQDSNVGELPLSPDVFARAEQYLGAEDAAYFRGAGASDTEIAFIANARGWDEGTTLLPNPVIAVPVRREAIARGRRVIEQEIEAERARAIADPDNEVPVESYDAALRFMRTVPDSFFDDLGVTFTDRMGEGTNAMFDWTTDLVTVNRRFVEAGESDAYRSNPLIEEFWHATSRLLPAKTVMRLHHQYARTIRDVAARDPWVAWVAANGSENLTTAQAREFADAFPAQATRLSDTGDGVYRVSARTREEYGLFSFDEWFARNMLLRTKGLVDAPDPSLSGPFRGVMQGLRSMVESIGNMFGRDYAGRVFGALVRGEYNQVVRRAPLDVTTRELFHEEVRNISDAMRGVVPESVRRDLVRASAVRAERRSPVLDPVPFLDDPSFKPQRDMIARSASVYADGKEVSLNRGLFDAMGPNAKRMMENAGSEATVKGTLGRALGQRRRDIEKWFFGSYFSRFRDARLNIDVEGRKVTIDTYAGREQAEQAMRQQTSREGSVTFWASDVMLSDTNLPMMLAAWGYDLPDVRGGGYMMPLLNADGRVDRDAGALFNMDVFTASSMDYMHQMVVLAEGLEPALQRQMSAEINIIREAAKETAGGPPPKVLLEAIAKVERELRDKMTGALPLPGGMSIQELVQSRHRISQFLRGSADLVSEDGRVLMKGGDETADLRARVNEAVTKRRELFETMGRALVRAGALSQAALDANPNYFHHQNMERVAQEVALMRSGGTTISDGAKGIFKKRRGSRSDISTSVLDVDYGVLATMMRELVQAMGWREFANSRMNILPNLRQIAKDTYGDAGLWTEVVRQNPDLAQDYELVSHSDVASLFNNQNAADWFFGTTVTSAIRQEVEGVVGRTGALFDMLGQARVEAGWAPEPPIGTDAVFVPKDVARHIRDRKEGLAASRQGMAAVSRRITSLIKQMLLLTPENVVRYTVNNFIGNSMAQFSAEGFGVWTQWRGAVHDIEDYLQTGNMTPEFAYFMANGGSTTSFTATDANVRMVAAARKVLDQSHGSPQRGLGALWKAVKGFDAKGPFFTVKTAAQLNQFIELMHRFGAYKYYLANPGRAGAASKTVLRKMDVPGHERMGTPPDGRLGETDQTGIPGQSDPRRAALIKANKLMIDYQNRSQFVQSLRQFWVPFAAFSAGNLNRFFMTLRNRIGAFPTDPLGAGIGMLQFVAGIAALPAIGMWLTETLLPEGADAVGDYDRQRGSIAFKIPFDSDRITVLRLQTDAQDVFEWIGGFMSIDLFKDYFGGRLGKADLMTELGKMPIKKAFFSLNPIVGETAGTLGGQTFFPDPFRPRPQTTPIDERLARTTGYNFAYTPIKDLFYPMPQIDRTPTGIALNTFWGMFPGRDMEPGLMATTDTYGAIDKFMRRHGIPASSIGGVQSDVTKLTRTYKYALRMKNERAANRLIPLLDNAIESDPMMRFTANPRSLQERLQAAVDGSHPFSRMTALMARSVIAEMTDAERAKAATAYEYYLKNFNPSQRERRKATAILATLRSGGAIAVNDRPWVREPRRLGGGSDPFQLPGGGRQRSPFDMPGFG